MTTPTTAKTKTTTLDNGQVLIKKFILAYNPGDLTSRRCRLNLLEIIYPLCLAIVLTCFVFTDSYSETGCKKSPERTKENTYSTCTQGIDIRLNDRFSKSFMRVKVKIPRIIRVKLYRHRVKIISFIVITVAYRIVKTVTLNYSICSFVIQGRKLHLIH